MNLGQILYNLALGKPSKVADIKLEHISMFGPLYITIEIEDGNGCGAWVCSRGSTSRTNHLSGIYRSCMSGRASKDVIKIIDIIKHLGHFKIDPEVSSSIDAKCEDYVTPKLTFSTFSASHLSGWVFMPEHSDVVVEAEAGALLDDKVAKTVGIGRWASPSAWEKIKKQYEI